MKQFVIWILLSILSGTLVGCRLTGANSLNESGETAVIAVAGSASLQPAYERLIQQFQEDYPHIQVQYIPLSPQQAALSLREQAALADVLLLEGWPPTPEAAAVFRDLSPLMAADFAFQANDFWPGLLAACQAAGVQVGLPFRANASLIFFDKAAFDAAGLPYPEPGWSWEDFRRAAQALTVSEGGQVAGGQTARYGFADGGNPLGLLAPFVDGLIAQSGDRLDGQRVAAELEWYVTLAEENAISTESGDPLNARRAAIWIGSQFGLAAAHAALGDNLGVAPFPAAAGTSSAGTPASNPASAGCALISAGSAHSQAAWRWVDYLSRQSLAATGLIPAAPARPSAAESHAYWAQMEAETAVAIRHALEHGWYRRAEMPELAAVGEALNQALTGAASLAESLPGAVEIQPTASPPPPDSAPVAVATPRAPSGAAETALLVEYFPNYNIHSSREAVVALAATFNQSQNRYRVTIVDRPPPFEGAFGPLEMAQVFDCFAHGGYIEVFARFQGVEVYKEALYSLAPFMVQEDNLFREDFDPVWLAQNEIEGELFALPGQIRPYVIVYNRDLLSELGLERPTPEWTIDDFWALAQAAASVENGGQVYGFVPGSLWPFYMTPLAPAAAYPFDRESVPPFAPTFDSPAVLQTLLWFERMVESGAMFPNDHFGAHQLLEYDRNLREEQDALIRGGGAAMWFDWAGEIRFYRFNTGVAPFPPSDLPGQMAQSSMLLISKRAADPNGCWEWFKFLTAQPNAFNGVPMRDSVRDSAAWRATVGDEAATAYEIMIARPAGLNAAPPGVIYPYLYWWSDILHAVFNGEAPAAVLERFQLLADAFYACYWQADDRDLDHGRTCARQVDPDFWQGRTLPTPP